MNSVSKAFAVALVTAAVVPGVALAQDEEDVVVEEGTPEPEPFPGSTDAPAAVAQPQEALDADTDDLPIGVPVFSVESSTEIHATENADLRALDETTDQAVIDTDDRRDFGFTDLVVTAGYRPDADTEFEGQAKVDVFWRDDQLGRSANSGAALNIYRLNFAYQVFESEPADVSFRIGRQAFSIGGVPRDYMLEGTLDAITAQADLKDFGRLRILAIDFFAGNDLPVGGYQFYRDGSETVFGLRGETNTLRMGGVYEIDEEMLGELGLMARAYYFYASVGGGPIEESGADISYGGTIGNHSDRDYQHMAGARAGYTLRFGSGRRGSVKLYGEFARSQGIDRKPAVARDVDTTGNAFGGGAVLETAITDTIGIDVEADFYSFDGANYASDGLEFERGFVGFRGARVGGLALARQAAWRPSAHLDASGLDHTPHDQSRSAGTQFIHAGAGIDIADTTLRVDFWLLTDTSESFAPVGNLQDIPDPPFGYSREEFAAQARNGKALGQEIDVELQHRFGEHVELYAGYGMFLPGEFYEIEAARVAGRRNTALGGTDTFWAFRFGGQVSF